MESIIINKQQNFQTSNSEKDIDVEDRSSDKSVSPPPSLPMVSSSVASTSSTSSTSQDRHGHVSSFLKFSIQNILQQAAQASTGASAAAAGVAAAASAQRRSNEYTDMAAAVMSELDLKRASAAGIGSLPFW